VRAHRKNRAEEGFKGFGQGQRVKKQGWIIIREIHNRGFGKMVDFGAAIKRPFENTETMVLGVIIGMVPLINILLVPGFALRNAKKTLEGNNKLLKFENFGDMVVKSIISLVIGIIYAIPVIVIAVLIGGLAIFGPLMAISTQAGPGGMTPEMAAPALAGIIGVVIIIAILALIVAFITPMAVMSWLKKDDIGAAFAVGEVLRKCFTGPYIIAWILSLVWLFILGLVMLALFFIPLIGALIGTGVVTYCGQVTSYTLYAQAFKEIK